MDESKKTKPEGESLSWLRESPPRPGLDSVKAHLKERGIPLSRESYLKVAYPDGAPNPMPAELEMMLPAEIRSF